MKQKTIKYSIYAAICIALIALLFHLLPQAAESYRIHKAEQTIARENKRVLELKAERNELEELQQKLSEKAEQARGEMKKAKNILGHGVAGEDGEMMEKICKYGKDGGNTTKLCDNRDLYYKLKDVAEERDVDFGLLLGISYAESKLGISWAPYQKCANSNNWAGMKRARNDVGDISEKFTTQYKNMPEEKRKNLEGCYLYNFDSIEEGWKSLANTIKFGYGNATPETISKYYVGSDGKVKPHRVKNVNLFK